LALYVSPASSQLADIKHKKDQIDEKLGKREWTAGDKKRTAGSVVPPHTTSDPAAA